MKKHTLQNKVNNIHYDFMLTLHFQVEKIAFTSQNSEFIMLLWNTPPWTFIIKTKSQHRNIQHNFMKDPTDMPLRLKLTFRTALTVHAHW